MIVAIKGILAKSLPLMAVVETPSGLFYEVNIPITTAEQLPRAGEKVFLHTVAVYKEDSQALYGFANETERDFFKTLIEKVSGIGPKIALNILSRMSVETLKGAIVAGDVSLLSKCPGIGKKTAERLIVELRDFMQSQSFTVSPKGAESNDLHSQQTSAFSDAVAALVALGYKLADADKAVRKAQDKLGSDATTEELIKQSFKG